MGVTIRCSGVLGVFDLNPEALVPNCVLCGVLNPNFKLDEANLLAAGDIEAKRSIGEPSLGDGLKIKRNMTPHLLNFIMALSEYS